MSRKDSTQVEPILGACSDQHQKLNTPQPPPTLSIECSPLISKYF